MKKNFRFDTKECTPNKPQEFFTYKKTNSRGPLFLELVCTVEIIQKENASSTFNMSLGCNSVPWKKNPYKRRFSEPTTR